MNTNNGYLQLISINSTINVVFSGEFIFTDDKKLIFNSKKNLFHSNNIYMN